ncbi:MAG: hypothetical protein AAGJ87_15525 [Pseudomonadota bacterium]
MPVQVRPPAPLKPREIKRSIDSRVVPDWIDPLPNLPLPDTGIFRFNLSAVDDCVQCFNLVRQANFISCETLSQIVGVGLICRYRNILQIIHHEIPIGLWSSNAVSQFLFVFVVHSLLLSLGE